MSDPMTVNPQVTDAIHQMQSAVLSPEVVLTSGAGKAYQSVAQSAAIAVQDATDALRNATTLATAATAAATAQFLATGDPRYLEALPRMAAIADKAIADYQAVGEAAASVLKAFPAG
ncbi:hypothetical protein FPZ54_07935 [Sphingomonas suaedae]|uniref:Phasin domain-containing protein n=1 Tax=Sphingomonas suaedae TaxID=2599297 RepID=A0A518REW1_9SPHN|nr:hypothetical protein [Sphingomonas suaedae]QDX25959.1 hypothetical protein FPZ54_07935 [Sphingomonas suaedae]